MYRFNLFVFFLSTCIHAQTLTPVLIGSGGGSENAGSIHLSFSLGESIVGTETVVTADLKFLTQGFQQPNVFSPALPVEWLSFTARADEDRNRLNWEVGQTGQESHFEVERSSDGIVFEFLGRQESITADQASYEWYDEDFPSQFLYYRIRQLDFDNAVTLSPIKTIDRSLDGNGKLVHFYPNPSSGSLRWIISIPGQIGPLNWQLFDTTGRLLRQHDLSAEPTAEINLSELLAGSYFYRILTATGSENGIIILR